MLYEVITKVMDGRLIFLSGSPLLRDTGPIPTGILSGISSHMVPRCLKSRRVPTFKTNCIENWEIKLDHIIQETLSLPMSVIGGIPPWVQMYFEKLIEKTGKKTIREIFPEFSLYIYGGVNYARITSYNVCYTKLLRHLHPGRYAANNTHW